MFLSCQPSSSSRLGAQGPCSSEPLGRRPQHRALHGPPARGPGSWRDTRGRSRSGGQCLGVVPRLVRPLSGGRGARLRRAQERRSARVARRLVRLRSAQPACGLPLRRRSGWAHRRCGFSFGEFVSGRTGMTLALWAAPGAALRRASLARPARRRNARSAPSPRFERPNARRSVSKRSIARRRQICRSVHAQEGGMKRTLRLGS